MKASLPIPRISQLVALTLILSVVLLMIASVPIAAQDGAMPTPESASAIELPPLPEVASTADATPTAGAESAPEVAPIGEPICGPTRHVSGEITSDTWWDAGYVYVLDGDVIEIGNSADGRLGAARHDVAHVVDDLLLAGADEGHELVEARNSRLAAGTEPAGFFGCRAAHDLAAIARHLGPGVRLHPVHPGAAELEVVTEPVVGPGAPADAISGFEGEHPVPRVSEVS